MREISPGLGDQTSLVRLRCSAAVIIDTSVLLLRRRRYLEDWVLPGGNPRDGEGTAACAIRETTEETGVEIDIDAVAFVLETITPDRSDRSIEIVFRAKPRRPGPVHLVAKEADMDPHLVSLDALVDLDLRPPIGGYLRGLHHARPRTGLYLGNVWRPENRDDAWGAPIGLEPGGRLDPASGPGGMR